MSLYGEGIYGEGIYGVPTMAGIVDLDVRYRDPESGSGIAVDSIRGIIKNAMGEVIEEITPEAYADTEGVYYGVMDYDARDASKFAGLFLTVDWIAIKGGLQLPTFPKRYNYVPVADNPADKTVIYWLPPETEHEIAYYDINRCRKVDDVVEEVLVGRSFGPNFIDTTVFENEFEARSWAYTMQAYYHKSGVVQEDGSDYVPLGVTIQPTMVSRTGLSLCLIEGRIRDVTGAPYRWSTERTESWVSFFMDWSDRHSYIGERGLYVTPAAVQIPLASDGGFSAALVQDVVATLLIEWSGLKARFVVPRKDHAFINELNMDIEKTW
jgi:hypothetical protein